MKRRETALLGEMLEHVTLLVNLTALDEGELAEGRGDGLAQAFVVVDDEQQCPIGRQLLVDEVLQQTAVDRGVLGCFFAQI